MAKSATVDGIIHPGPPGAPSVIMSSGLGGSGSFWAPQMKALTQHFDVILYDHRGTGRSARALPKSLTYSVDQMAEDIVAVMDAVGLQSASVVGHAAGGLAGLALALNNPERLERLVVVNGWSQPDPHIARCFETRIALLKNTGPLAYIRAQPIFLYPANWISQNSSLLEAEESHMVAGFPTNEVMLARIGALLAFDIDARLSRIDTPVLLSASADDMLVPVLCSRRMARLLPRATLDVVPWGGHAFTITAAHAFNESLIAYLSGKPLPSPSEI